MNSYFKNPSVAIQIYRKIRISGWDIRVMSTPDWYATISAACDDKKLTAHANDYDDALGMLKYAIENEFDGDVLRDFGSAGTVELPLGVRRETA